MKSAAVNKSFQSSPFIKARLVLTGWYVVILGVLIGIFTLLVLNAREASFVRVHRVVQNSGATETQVTEFEDQFSQFSRRFEERLYIFDMVLFLVTAVISYFLAGKTLAPIQRMMQEQEEFSADVSHELRTPLTTMRITVDAYTRTHKRLQPELKMMLASLGEEVGHMTQIIEGLLTLMRIKNTRVHAKREEIELVSLVQTATAKLKIQAEAKRQRIVVKGLRKGVRVLGYREQLLQVAVILLDNAIKYAPAISRIEVVIDKDKSYAKLTVINQVKSILPTGMGRMFERFYRGHDQIKVKGTGLGLAIAKKMIDHHQGMIRAIRLGPHRLKMEVRLPSNS